MADATNLLRRLDERDDGWNFALRDTVCVPRTRNFRGLQGDPRQDDVGLLRDVLLSIAGKLENQIIRVDLITDFHQLPTRDRRLFRSTRTRGDFGIRRNAPMGNERENCKAH